jgi:patatin-like phospholipase/acyl hydrolase
MKDLFNMTAGTSTGSIIAAGLAYPDANCTGRPKYYGNDAIKMYRENAKVIF